MVTCYFFRRERTVTSWKIDIWSCVEMMRHVVICHVLVNAFKMTLSFK